MEKNCLARLCTAVWRNRFWLEQGNVLVVPEIADYEVRRELLRADKVNGVKRLDLIKTTFAYGLILADFHKAIPRRIWLPGIGLVDYYVSELPIREPDGKKFPRLDPDCDRLKCIASKILQLDYAVGRHARITDLEGTTFRECVRLRRC